MILRLVSWIGLLLIQIAGMTVCAAIDFVRDIAPIFEAHCISCHGVDSAKGGVRLDTAEGMREVISIDDIDHSLLIEQIAGPEPAMPKNAKPLANDQVALFKA
jgi:mono/diheme cytochrome c family protein